MVLPTPFYLFFSDLESKESFNSIKVIKGISSMLQANHLSLQFGKIEKKTCTHSYDINTPFTASTNKIDQWKAVKLSANILLTFSGFYFYHKLQTEHSSQPWRLYIYNQSLSPWKTCTFCLPSRQGHLNDVSGQSWFDCFVCMDT